MTPDAMTLDAPASSAPLQATPARKPLEKLATRLALVTAVAALFGQPNALFVYLPIYPIIALLLILILSGLAAYTLVRGRPHALPTINLFLPTLIFLSYSSVSLAYAPDMLYGARILSSMAFKFLLFLSLVVCCAREEDIRKLLLIVAALGSLFSVQGLLYVAGKLFFNLQPIGFIQSVSSFGPRDYGLALESYGILGFAKAYNTIGGISLPRCQAMFMEPGWFGTFLELSLFATLGWFSLTGYVHKKATYWMLGLQIVALLFSFSSAAWFAVAAGALLYIALRLFVRPATLSRRRLRQVGVAVLSLVTLLVVLSIGFPAVAEDIYRAVYLAKFVGDAQELTSSSDRLSKAADSLVLFQQKPFFGWGSNQLPIIAAKGQSVGNAFLTAATELGVLGLAVYVTMLGAISWTVFTNMRAAYRLRSEAQIGLSAALAGFLLASFVHSMFVDSEWLFCYWVGLALIYINRRLLIRLAAGPAEGDAHLQQE